MSETLEVSALRLADAQQRGDADDIAEALARHANALLEGGQTGPAQKALDEATAIHALRGRAYDEAQCLQMAGTLCRFLGRLDEARTRELRALDLVEAKGPIAVSAHTELGEIALAAGLGAEAAAEYRSALEAGASIGLVGSVRAGLLRKRAAALAVERSYPEAIRDLETACELLLREGDRTSATRTLIEEATAFQHNRQFDSAEPVIRSAMQLAEPAGDYAAMADINLLIATQALERRDADRALAAARAARTQALAANSPTAYIGASLAIAQLAEYGGDRLGAYEALAVGWATLADLLGSGLARRAFEPKLREARERWGTSVFEEIKKNYEANRRTYLREQA